GAVPCLPGASEVHPPRPPAEPPLATRAETDLIPRWREGAMSPLPEEPGHALEQYRAYLECPRSIRLDPRLWRRFRWPHIAHDTLLEASHELPMLQGLPEADRKRRLRRMLVHNLLQRIDYERAQKRDVRLEVGLDDALAGSSCDLQRSLATDSPGPDGRAAAAEEGAPGQRLDAAAGAGA